MFIKKNICIHFLFSINIFINISINIYSVINSALHYIDQTHANSHQSNIMEFLRIDSFTVSTNQRGTDRRLACGIVSSARIYFITVRIPVTLYPCRRAATSRSSPSIDFQWSAGGDSFIVSDSNRVEISRRILAVHSKSVHRAGFVVYFYSNSFELQP